MTMLFSKVKLLAFALMIIALDGFTQSTVAKQTYVIVHGAWGGSWAFKKVDSLLTVQGHVVYRPSLTGQGERAHLSSTEINLSLHINDVVNSILYENLHDVILIGHSYGGMVVSGVADSIPDRIKKLVYLDAMVPNDGESVMDIMNARADWIKSMTKDGYIIPSWVKPGQQPPKDVPHPLKTFTEPISLKNSKSKKISTAYVLTVEAGKKPEDDDFAKSAKRARDRGWPVYNLTSDHNPQWSAPNDLVKMLLGL